jgi:nucleoside-diphosphate-sugar epimerase
MRALVTGSNGYLGCVLTPQLMAVRHEVVGLDIGYVKLPPGRLVNELLEAQGQLPVGVPPRLAGKHGLL